MGSRKAIFSYCWSFCQHFSKPSILNVYETRIVCFSTSHKFLTPQFSKASLGNNTHTMAMNETGEKVVHKYNSMTVPSIVKCNTPEFRSLFSKGLIIIKDLFEKNNFELRLCGGAVRDLLMGINPKDLDFATTATPDQIVALLEANEIRIINMGGRDHGTVACRVEEENFEITTLRIDVLTDGRHAKIEYTTDWQLDALRRDLTINSLFMTLDGEIIDYFGGMIDLENKFIRFVGQASDRIQEDYLRILRYFRFYGRIVSLSSPHDIETLNIITQNGDGLKGISGQRIWTEIKLILGGKHPVEILKMIHKCGLFSVIGLNQNPDFDNMQQVYNKTKHLSPNYMVLIAALFRHENEILFLHDRVFLSNKEKAVVNFIVQHRDLVKPGVNMTSQYIDWLVEGRRDFKQSKFLFDGFTEFLKYIGNVEMIQFFHSFNIPVCPVTGGNIKEICPKIRGKKIGEACNILYKKWKASGYTLTKEELLSNLDQHTDLDILKNENQ